MTEATDQEMIAAVERWARAMGFTKGMAPWYVVIIENEVRISRRHQDYKRRAEAASFKPLYERTDVSPHAALVWALMLEARPLRDGSRCRRCFGRGTWDEWRQHRFSDPSTAHLRDRVERARAELQADGWEHEGWYCPPDDEDQWGAVLVVASRTIQCPGCDGSGIADMTDEFAQHVLDAQPVQHGNPAVYTWTRPGNQASIEALHVLADRLQTEGDPLGTDIAILLAGERRGTSAALERLVAKASDPTTITAALGTRSNPDVVADLIGQLIAGDGHHGTESIRVNDSTLVRPRSWTATVTPVRTAPRPDWLGLAARLTKSRRRFAQLRNRQATVPAS